MSGQLIHVEVTGEYIERGKPDSCSHCPIALVLREAYPEATVIVTPTWASINNQYYLLPPNASQFIKRYDEGKRVSEIAFDLRKAA